MGDVISDGVGNDYSSISIARAAIAAYEQHLADTGMVTVRMGVREMHDDIVKAVFANKPNDETRTRERVSDR